MNFLNYYHEDLQRISYFVQKDMASKSMGSEEMEWSSRAETLLLYALFNRKPVGVDRFFTMLGIHLKFSNYIKREITSKVIWDHLDSMYNMPALHESENLPFPNEEVDFELPEELNDLVKEKFGASSLATPNENEVAKNGSSGKTMKKSSTSKIKQNSTNDVDTLLMPPPIKPMKTYTDTRSPAAEIVKVKQESPSQVKVNKVKRSSSPFTVGKNVKSESSSVKEEPVDASKKTNKVESRNSSSGKQISKSEPNTSTSKKSIKQEPSTNSVRQGKSETSDISHKKIKNEKELTKKGRTSTSSENSISKKNSKTDSKKTESDRKSSESSSHKSKTEKNSSTSGKAAKIEENESSGSRKSVGKTELSDKKRKRQKLEESAKKSAPPAKRRRL
ncbi:hypothetical protein CEXT_64181 [Caerostris extrusa]|uniref:MRG-binding protein n=1 Tax=Caerostris extrusa TaxID=172846 RepID=A0AAV4Q9L6_CAEEX|nr:hypothetical protein CEXT_64181 [Caerostris extrusa]